MAIIFHDGLQKDLEKYFKYGSHRTRLFHRLRINLMRELLERHKVKDLNILDVGCSAGAHAILASQNNTSVVGIDPDVPSLNKFKRWIKQKKINNIKVLEGVAEKIPYPDNHFDTIICSEVLEHVQDIKKSVDEIYRVLKPEGLLFLSMPNKLGFDYIFLERYLNKHSKDNDPHTQFSPKRIKSLFPKFKIIREYGNGILMVPWRFLPRITMHKPISFLYYHLDKIAGRTPLKLLGTNYFLVLQKTSGDN